MKHKHADLIKAWADGAKIQSKNPDETWVDLNEPIWINSSEYRIKPEPKPDIVVFVPAGDPRLYRTEQRDGDNMCLIYDGETGKLKSAEVLK